MADIAFLLGGVVPVALISYILRRIFLGRNAAPGGAILCVVLAWVMAGALASFGEGTGSFEDRVANIPAARPFILYGVSAIIVAVLTLLAIRGRKADPSD